MLAPLRRSFGSHLIERSLDSFGGRASLEFAPEGVVCRIRLPGAQVRVDGEPPAPAGA